MADKTFSDFKAGIDRTRTRATAKAGTFWSLVNAYITAGGVVQKRQGFRHVVRLDSATHGLFANGGKLHTFFSEGTLTAPPGVNLIYHALRAPDDDSGTAPVLVKVYSDHLFLGKQYVAAQFSDDVIRHYWLKDPAAWQTAHVYTTDDLVQPSSPNGYYYRPTASVSPPAWQPNTQYAVDAVVQPTVYNGYQYTLIEVAGANPSSGATEPAWLTSEGALVYEDVDSTPQPTQPTSGGGTPGGDRYGNLPSYKQDQLGGEK